MRYVETFFDDLTADSAYVLGLFASDGCMYQNKRGSRYISFTSTDEELILQVKQILKLSNLIEVYNRKGNFKTSYTLQIGSKILFNKFTSLGFTSNKSKTLTFPGIPQQFICHFIRGYFDGDGSIYYKSIARRNRRGTIKYLILNLRCGSKNFLEVMRSNTSLITKIGKGSLYFHSGAYSLAYSGKDVVKLYDFLYPAPSIPHLERKRVSFEKGIKSILRP